MSLNNFPLFTLFLLIHSATSADNSRPWIPISKIGFGLVSKPQARVIVSSARRMSNEGIIKTAPTNKINSNPLNTFGACTSSITGQSGVCIPPGLCNLYRSSLGSSCNKFGGVCCINTVSDCGQVVTINNTYWQSPSSINTPQCSLTVKLDNNLAEQKKPICQIRLDFDKFTIAQPDVDSACSDDRFSVLGATNKIPVICGDNDGQHMYLNVPASNSTKTVSELQLDFKFGAVGNFTRRWKMKIAFLPCGADYLAPDNCLQYITQVNGTVSSFNYKHVVPRANNVRQLANQDYKICFRDELINGQAARSTCITPCHTKNDQVKWFNTIGNAVTSTGMLLTCSSDYIAFTNPFIELANGRPLVVKNDRFCGTITRHNFHQNFQALCTPHKPFELNYFTDGDESGDVGNTGLCFEFTQRLSVAQHPLKIA